MHFVYNSFIKGFVRAYRRGNFDKSFGRDELINKVHKDTEKPREIIRKSLFLTTRFVYESYPSHLDGQSEYMKTWQEK